MRGIIGPWDTIVDAESATDAPARIAVRLARAGDLVDAYPAGEQDREFAVEGTPTSAALEAAAHAVFTEDPRCRRVVLPADEQDLAEIAWAESGGFRYVVDVETRQGRYSLLVSEPRWVIEQPSALDEIPIKE